MSNYNPEDWRRVWQNTKENQNKSDQERQEAAENTRVEKIIGAIDSVVKQLYRQTDEKAPKNKSERRWKRAEVLGLWAAAAVGVTAIVVANHDAEGQLSSLNNQVTAMRGQINEMKAAGERTNKLIAANEKVATKITVGGQLSICTVGHRAD